MTQCTICGKRADFKEKCPFRGYENLYVCLVHKNEEERFHRDMDGKRPVFEAVVNFSLVRRR